MWQDAWKNHNGDGRNKKFWTAQSFKPLTTTGSARGKDNALETHVMIHVPAVIKTWGDTVRYESLAVCHGQSIVIGHVLRIGIIGNSVCLAA